MVERGYDAASKTRINVNWSTANRSADLELFSDADVTRGRARDLVRNNAYARGVQRAIVRNVVNTGIRPQARVEFGSGRPHQTFNDAAEKLFDKWQKQADVTGRLSFYEMQRLIVSEVVEAGECLVRFVRSSDRSRSLPLALELIEADRLATDHDFMLNRRSANGNEIRRGVEINSEGVPVAYWLYPRHPNDLNALWTRPERFPAGEFLHLFIQERIGQTRGVSHFAPIVRWAHGLHRYVDHEMIAAEVASCFSVAIKTIDGSGGIATPSGEDSSDDDGNTFSHLQAGLVARLLPDEEVQVINPGRSQSESAVFLQMMQRSMAIGTGLSYERLTRDYSQTNFSSNRASDLEDRREFRPMQDWLICNLCIPVWLRFMGWAVRTGANGFPNDTAFMTQFDRWTSHVWQPRGWEWVDPAKEAKASIDAIENNLSTLSDECAGKGKDWRDVQRQRAIELKNWQELQAEFELQAAADSEETETADSEMETDGEEETTETATATA